MIQQLVKILDQTIVSVISIRDQKKVHVVLKVMFGDVERKEFIFLAAEDRDGDLVLSLI